MTSLRWVPAQLVVDVVFVEWTRDGLLRHQMFVGIRDDKPARDVRRES
jgi:bifunctional non-homologous end joining protein LigD